MIFGRQGICFCLPFFCYRDIIKKSVFQMSGETLSAGV